MMDPFIWFKRIGVSGFLDIILMALLIYATLVWFKRNRAAFILSGILIVSGIYLLTRQFNMSMTAEVFEKFFTVILIALIVIFQEELKNIFETVAVWSLNRRLKRRKLTHLSREEVETIVRTFTDFAKEKIGALIVIKGRDMVIRYLDGGTHLNGDISEPLFKSLFDPHSIGHDGAVYIEGKQVKRFSCHLPLSKNIKKVGMRGTRHAAALGLSERTDALTLVVSEERGEISYARRGELNTISNPEKLTLILERFYHEIDPARQEKPWLELLRKNTREKVIAFFLSVALWFVLVRGAELTYRTYTVSLAYPKHVGELKVEEVAPLACEVTLSGPHREFYFLTKEQIKILLRLRIKEGDQTIRLATTDLVLPRNLAVENIEPQNIKVRLEKLPEKKDRESNHQSSDTQNQKPAL
jgi:diadenylate cyclase